jgi:hypothetical protein
MVNLAEDPDYFKFVKCWGNENFDGAILHLEFVLKKVRKPGDGSLLPHCRLWRQQ